MKRILWLLSLLVMLAAFHRELTEGMLVLANELLGGPTCGGGWPVE